MTTAGLTPSSPRILVSTGEPAGIGPDICIQSAARGIEPSCVYLADPLVLQDRARLLGVDLSIDVIGEIEDIGESRPGHMRCIPVPCAAAVSPGTPNRATAPAVIAMLERAMELITANKFDALVTAPVHKAVINEAGIKFTGHTEWLASRTNVGQPLMMLANETMRVALATTHLPISDITKYITPGLLESVIRILHSELQKKFGITEPRIRICGINPHAGESGYLGNEEISIMQPVIRRLQEEGFHLEGPVAADTAFLPYTLDKTDVILGMYHDQVLPVIKYAGFDTAVNITLNLPVIRTSVDHGTALELAGTGKADPSSLMAAISMAAQIAARKNG